MLSIGFYDSGMRWRGSLGARAIPTEALSPDDGLPR
jgi:hypothetical protein